MGNCQAAEAATVVIQHPGNHKIERIYWSVSAHEIMNANPGHYVALLITSSSSASASTTTHFSNSQNGNQIKQLKLLRPDDTLLIGHVYRLITFQDVLKEFAAKKCVKLGKLLKEGGALSVGKNTNDSNSASNSKSQNYTKPEQEADGGQENSDAGSSGGGRGGQRSMGRHYGGGGQWRPALQSIAEVGIN